MVPRQMPQPKGCTRRKLVKWLEYYELRLQQHDEDFLAENLDEVKRNLIPMASEKEDLEDGADNCGLVSYSSNDAPMSENVSPKRI